MKTPRLSSRQLLIYLNPWYSTIEKLVIAPILINSHWICKNHLIKPGLVVSRFRLWKLVKITTKVFYSSKSGRLKTGIHRLIGQTLVVRSEISKIFRVVFFLTFSVLVWVGPRFFHQNLSRFHSISLQFYLEFKFPKSHPN